MSSIENTKPLANFPPLGDGGELRNLYFIGIGGIGMSALARFFLSRNCVVGGYDKTSTPLTRQLEAEGVNIHYEENTALIPKEVDVVVYTPAIPSAHQELVYYREHGYKVVKRSDVLQWITESSFNVCVGGTHGKTTITTMVAYVLRETGYGCNAFLGGISANYGTNFWSNEKNVCVIEADEYDRSFLKLSPDVAVITAMDADHLDIYGTPEEMENAYVQFTQRVKPGGCLISKYGLKRDAELNATTHYRYSFDNTRANVYAKNLRVENGAYIYDVVVNGEEIKDVLLHLGGLHNIENSIAAIAVAKYLGIDNEKIKSAVSAFKGVKRRFERTITSEAVVIDDYAHHPDELKALITGVRSLYKQKLTVVFQPHLYSRTRDFADEFAASLDLADEVILLPVYPARELPIPGVNSELILNKMKLANKRVLSKEEMLKAVQEEKPVLLVMCGAGDIDALVPMASRLLESPFPKGE